MRLTLLAGTYAVCRLEDDALAPVPPPGSADTRELFWSLTHARGERSLVCPEGLAPDPRDGAAAVVGGWRILEVAGPMDLGLTGVMAALAAPLADAGVPILPIGTHDTDWILVPGAQLEAALGALRAAGHEVEDAQAA
jgi:hypothetical protein